MSDCQPMPCVICQTNVCYDPECPIHPDVWELSAGNAKVACSEKCYFLTMNQEK